MSPKTRTSGNNPREAVAAAYAVAAVAVVAAAVAAAAVAVAALAVAVLASNAKLLSITVLKV